MNGECILLYCFRIILYTLVGMDTRLVWAFLGKARPLDGSYFQRTEKGTRAGATFFVLFCLRSKIAEMKDACYMPRFFFVMCLVGLSIHRALCGVVGGLRCLCRTLFQSQPLFAFYLVAVTFVSGTFLLLCGDIFIVAATPRRPGPFASPRRTHGRRHPFLMMRRV